MWTALVEGHVPLLDGEAANKIRASNAAFEHLAGIVAKPQTDADKECIDLVYVDYLRARGWTCEKEDA